MARVTARDLIVEIVRRSGGELTGKTKLYKAFYFAHLLYSQESPDLLTTHPIVRMPQGPGIDNGDAVIRELVASGQLVEERLQSGFYPECRYRLTEAGKASPALDHDIGDIIQRVADFVRDKTATELSQLTHDRSRSWIEAESGQELNIEIDMIPDEEYAQRQALIKKLEAQLGGMF